MTLIIAQEYRKLLIGALSIFDTMEDAVRPGLTELSADI